MRFGFHMILREYDWLPLVPPTSEVIANFIGIRESFYFAIESRRIYEVRRKGNWRFEFAIHNRGAIISAVDTNSLYAGQLSDKQSNQRSTLNKQGPSDAAPYKGKVDDSKARASLRFCARVFITVGRTTTFMPRAEIVADCDLSEGSMTKVPVKSA